MALYRCAGARRTDEDGNPVCAYEAERRWPGRCPSCGQPYAVLRLGVERDQKTKYMTSSSDVDDVEHLPTGIDGFDKISGGGLVAGHVILLGGEEGAGKTSLAQMIVNGIAKKRTALYVSAEQPSEELVLIQRRLGIVNERVKFYGNTSNVYSAIEACRELRPIVAVFDSVSMMTVDEDGAVGSRTQGEQVLNVIRTHCKKTGMCGVAINQLGADGFFKGSTMLRYMVDSLMYLDKIFATEKDWEDRRKTRLRGLVGFENAKRHEDVSGLRELISGKNRNAKETQKAYFEMTKKGILVSVEKKEESNVISF